MQRLRDETRDLREELDVLHKTNTEKAINLTNASNKGTPIVTSSRMKSILSEAAASGATPTHDSTNRQGKIPSNSNLSFIDFFQAWLTAITKHHRLYMVIKTVFPLLQHPSHLHYPQQQISLVLLYLVLHHLQSNSNYQRISIVQILILPLFQMISRNHYLFLHDYNH